MVGWPKLNRAETHFLEAALLISSLCLGMFFLRLALTGTSRYWFVPQNLLLAWAALVFSWLLTKRLQNHSWLSWQPIILTLFWLALLPNTWYVMTDLTHIVVTGEISQLYDITLFNSLVIVGFMAGFTSLLLVHKQILRRLAPISASLIVTAIILFASFAIYIGRDLRWNSWDIIANPGGLILNVSDRLTDPFGRPRMVNVTSLFFLTIGVGYAALWRLAKPRR